MTKEALADGATFLVADVRKDSWAKIEEYQGIKFLKETTAWLYLSRKTSNAIEEFRGKFLCSNGMRKVKARHAPFPQQLP